MRVLPRRFSPRSLLAVGVAFVLFALGCVPHVSVADTRHALIGTWAATWPDGPRHEIRVDSVSDDGVVLGTFCGVRRNDGSVFFFDFAVAEPSFDGGVLALRRGKHSYWFRADPGTGVDFVYRRRDSSAQRVLMLPSEATDLLQCIDRIVPAGDRFDHLSSVSSVAQGYTGVWSVEDDGGSVTELRSSVSDADAFSGTLCYTRSDGSIAFFDFAPGARIEAQRSDGGYAVVRAPFRVRLTHRFDAAQSDALRYRERLRRKPWRMDVALTRALHPAGCLHRIMPP